MRRLEVYEILELFSKAKNKKERVEVLQKYSQLGALRDVLRGTFDDSLQFNLPKGTPPYTPNRPESVPSTLLKKHREFGLFVESGTNDRLPAYRREMKFVQLLESIHPKDAELVLAMKDKDLDIKFLTKKLVQEVFPTLIQS